MKHMEPRWWAKEFGKQYIDTIQPVFTKQKTIKEVDFIVRTTQLSINNRILDLCCGHGRHSIELAKRGYNVIGLDYSSYGIRIANRLAGEARVHPIFKQVDVQKISYTNRFDEIISMCTSFGYFSHTKNQQMLKRIYTSLKPNGQFILDVLNTEQFLSEMKLNGRQIKPGVYECKKYKRNGPYTMNNTITSDEGTAVSHHKKNWSCGAKNGELNFYIRRYKVQQLKFMLKKAGFHVHKIFGDYEGNKWKKTSNRTIILAKKNE